MGRFLRAKRDAGELELMFKKWDKSGNGTINKKELRGMMREMGVRLRSEQVDTLLVDFDRDGTGDLSFGELNLMAAVVGGAAHAHHAHPIDEDKAHAHEKSDVSHVGGVSQVRRAARQSACS